MPFESVLFLGIVIAALGVFTATLSYGQWVTRHLNRDDASATAKPLQVSKAPDSAHSRNTARAYEEAL